MLLWIIIAALPAMAQNPEAFPELELKKAISRQIILQVGQAVQNGSGRGEKYDPSVGLQTCGELDKRWPEGTKKFQDAFTAAQKRRLEGDPNWFQDIAEKLELPLAKFKSGTFKDFLVRESQFRWDCKYPQVVPCHDSFSKEYINSMANDPEIIDDPPINTCVRLTKIWRKTGLCSDTVPSPCGN